jgi:D-glucosaminate-6-phosphate ammonia-lyase
MSKKIYSDLGIDPIINAIGSVTLLGGSTQPPEVVEAMQSAQDMYVPMDELEEKAGGYLADLFGAEACYITSGAGSALTLTTAAFMAGDNDDLIVQLPDTTGIKNEILIQSRQRYHYERCLTYAGAKLVEFGSSEKVTKDDLQKSIGDKTVAVHYVANETINDPNALSLEDTLEIAKKNDLPVMVDAAGQIYPLSNLSKYSKMGADSVSYAAKYFGAPHSTGFVVGTKDVVRKVALQSFISYEMRRVRGVGRPQKIDRQEIIGAVAAAKIWMNMNHEDRLAKAERTCAVIASHIKGIEGVDVEVQENTIGHDPHGVKITLTKEGASLVSVQEALKNGSPRIWMRCDQDLDGNYDENNARISPFGLYPGEDEIVGSRLSEELKKL